MHSTASRTRSVGDEPEFSISGVVVQEGDSGTTDATFTISRLDSGSWDVSVDYATADGTATAGNDYTSVSGTVIFEGFGETSKQVTVSVIGDRSIETDETFFLVLSQWGSEVARGVGTIRNDDVLSIGINDATVTEGESGTTTATFTVSLSAPSSQTVTVDYATADGTATAGSDYTSANGTLTFSPGQTSQQVNVSVFGDTSKELDETFFVNLSNPTNATLGDSQGLGTIQTDDMPSLGINDVTVTEGNSGTTDATFALALSAPTTDTVTVDYGTADGTARAGSDYTSANGRVTFSPGQTSQQVTVSVMGDTTMEWDETFSVNLSNATNAALRDSQGAGIIQSDELPLLTTDGLAVRLVAILGGAFDTILVAFNKAVQDGTFTVDDVTLTGTGGPVRPVSLTKLSNTEYRMEFTGLTGVPRYTLVIGPDVMATDGQPMDQDEDRVVLEGEEDAYFGHLVGGDLTIAADDTTYDHRSLVFSGGTLTINGSHQFDVVGLFGGGTATQTEATLETSALTISSGSTLTLAGGTTVTVRHKLLIIGSTVVVGGKNRQGQVDGAWAGVGGTINSEDLDVDSRSQITADRQGYVDGPGRGGYLGMFPSGPGGGGYGGRGGSTSTNSGGIAYGSSTGPVDLGSAGASGASSYGGDYSGGDGGGAIRINVTGTLRLDGVVTANGQDGASFDLNPSGGGSGGSIWITTATLMGTGAIWADGGSGAGGAWGHSSGGGAGGRIALYYTDASGFDFGHVTAVGLWGGQSGTIVRKIAAPTGVDLLGSSDTGILYTDDLTGLDNSTTAKRLEFQVAGTAPGATVRLYSGGTLIGSAVAAGATTTVTTNGTVDLPDGVRSITARQVQGSDAESADSPALNITVDTSAPARPAAPDLDPGSDSGLSNSDNVTNRTQLTIDVGGLATSYRLYRSGTQVGGDYLATSPYVDTGLTAGAYAYTVRAVDPAGNLSDASPSLNVEVNTAGPHVSALTPAPGSTVRAALTVVATFDMALVPTTVTGDTFKVSSAQGGDGQWGTGDDTYVPGTVTYDLGTRRATFTPTTPLPGGLYAAWLDGGSSIVDLAGNTLDGEFGTALPSGDGSPGGDLLATFTVDPLAEMVELSSTNRRMQFLDADGDTVTVTFGGSPGTATITRGAAHQGDRGDIDSIVFDGTDPRTSLTITVKESKAGTPGDGTTVQTISGDGVGTLNMKNVDLAGNTLTLDGLKKLIVDDILDGSHIILGGSAADTLTLTANRVGNVNLEFPGILKSATVTRWAGGRIDVGRLDSLTVRSGALGADIEADGVVGSVTVKGGNLAGDILVRNVTGQTRTPALRNVMVTGGDITGSITVENRGNAGAIQAKATRGVGGSIGDGADDAITVAGRLTSVTSNGHIRSAITVENDSGATKGNALGLVKAIGGSLFGAVEVLNNGNLGTLQAKHIMANVMVDGNAALVRTELDDVVTPLPPQTQAQATITTGGKATVRGKNGLVKIGEDGGDAFVV